MSTDNIQGDENNPASESAGEDGPKHLPPSDEKDIKVTIAEIVGGIILFAAAEILFDSNFHTLGDVFMFISILCGIHIVSSHCKAAGVKKVNQWSMAAVVAAALFLICFAHRPDAAPPTFMLSKPDAEEIIDKYQEAIPMQQSSVASGFVGLSIIWKLHLKKATEDQGIVHLVLASSYSGADISNIRMDVPGKGHEFLEVAKRGDYFIVKASIERVSDSGIDLAPSGTILPAN
jgi:hypothetical protein